MAKSKNVIKAEGEVTHTPERPSMHSKEWSNWVMGHFSEDEVFDGCPTRDALARVAEELIGRVIDSYSRTVQAPNIDNGLHAVCEHTVVFHLPGNDGDTMGTGATVRYSDVGEASTLNTTPDFLAHGAATAATRAEARALRKALRLRRVYSAEEMVDGVAEIQDVGFISDTQIRFINQFCKRLNIDVLKFVNSGKEKYADYHQIPYGTAQKMFKRLNEYQQKVTPVPAELVGFKEGWM